MNKEDQKLLEVAICGYLPHKPMVVLKHDMHDDFEHIDLEDEFLDKGNRLQLQCFNHHDSIGLENGEMSDVIVSNKNQWISVGKDDILLELHPIECLTKPITVEGYNEGMEFVPIEEMCKEFYFHKSKTDYKITKTHVYTSCESRNGESVYVMKDYNKIDYWIIEYLNQWHIDWRGLIPKGLAVAITA